MSNTFNDSIPQKQARTGRPGGDRSYHHGDLRNGLLEAARSILEEQDLSALTLRAVARRAGSVMPRLYRHFPNHFQKPCWSNWGWKVSRGTAPVVIIVGCRQGGRPGIRSVSRQYRRRLYALCGAAPGGGAADVRPATAAS